MPSSTLRKEWQRRKQPKAMPVVEEPVVEEPVVEVEEVVEDVEVDEDE